MHEDYSYLSKLFSETDGIIIEKYMINQKIEKVKELIVYDELNLTEITYQLGYSSVSHLLRNLKKPPDFLQHTLKKFQVIAASIRYSVTTDKSISLF